MNLKSLSIFAGPACFALAYLWVWSGANPELATATKLMAGIAAWMAIWWITEAVNTAVTALLPLVLFPITGIMNLKTTAAEYSNEIIYLFMAGFFFGKAIEYWNLHRRIALTMVNRLGSDPSKMLLGFMLATAFISMWISNTATAVMMTPVGIAVAGAQMSNGKGANNFGKSLMLGICYACSIGGMATLVGTPTNAIFVSFVNQKFNMNVSFWQWFQFGFPFATVLLFLSWWLLIKMFPLEKNMLSASDKGIVKSELNALGLLTSAEKRLMFLFGTVIFGWISGSLIWYDWLKWSSSTGDTVVAMSGAILLFLLPSKTKTDQPLFDWKTAEKIPWGVIVFFGGGLAMAKGVETSGLAKYLGTQMEGLSAMPVWIILLIVLLVVVLLSEVASNIATASMMMPVLASLAVALNLDAYGLLMSATLAASIGFGLPIATAPNTIAFSSGYLSTKDMAKAGFLLDIIAVILLLLFVYGLKMVG
jgi:solute carrier family 13 (sodium-dependent dicarboxylate transporter), member 2/3/5